MKILLAIAVIAMPFCQMAFAKDPVPLAKAASGDRTNHPVLFVSGLGSNPSGTWGAKGREFYCEKPELATDIAPMVKSFEWTDLHNTPVMGVGALVVRVAYPYRCDNAAKPVYDGEVTLPAEFIVYKGKSLEKEKIKLSIQPFPAGRNSEGFWLFKGGFTQLWGEMSIWDQIERTMEVRDDSAKAKALSDYLFCQSAMNPFKGIPKLEDVLACTGTFVSADSLLDRSRAAMAAETETNVAQHPVEDWDWQHDLPARYEATGLPAAIAELFDLPARNTDSTYAKITNGIYFFNAKGRCHASDQDGIGAECDALDEWANPRWDTSFENYGQPNQLLDKMVRSLDDFYGKGKWHDDPNAVIDIVAHSQGGLITRIAVEKSRGREGRNPINHINRIITINSPHRGSALATSPNWLNYGNPDDEGATYPQLAELKEWLFSKDEFVSLRGSMNLVLVKWVRALQALSTPMPNLGSLFGWSNVSASVDFSGAPLGPYKFDLEIDAKLASVLPLELKHEDGTITLGDIGELAMKSEHLAWPAESDYMRELDAMPYPTYPKDGRNIHVTHFYNKGLRHDFLELFGAHLLQWGYNQCLEAVHNSGYDAFIDADGTCSKLFVYVKMGRFGNSLEKLEKRFKKLDTDWPWRSDLVVENSSQRGIHSETGYSEDKTPEFHPKAFWWNRNTVIHGALSDDLSNIVKDMGLAAATRQKCDVLSELGVSTTRLEKTCDLPTSIERVAYAYALDNLSKSIGLLIKNAPESDKSKLKALEYYFAAEPGKALDVKTSGAEASVTVEHVAGAIHKATVRPAAPAEGDWPAAGEFTLSIGYADGTPRDASNDPSMPVSDGIALSIPVFDETGRRVGGLVPSLDTTAQGVADLYEVRVEAKERSQTGNVSQPSVRVTNTGDLALPGFRLRYTFKTAKKPELRVYWIDRMPNAAWSLVDLGENLHAVEFVYSGIDLKKGESVSPVDFELFHADWSPWNRADDHSALGVGGEWAPAPFVELFTLDGGRLWGISPDMIPSDSTETEPPRLSLKVLGREESALANKSTHRLRVVNDGDLPVTGFKVYDYFTSEGPEPLFEPWDVPRCAVSKEWLGGLDWRMVYDCSDAVLDPGQEIDWAEWGMLVDRHYPDWSAWDASNDWSALTSEWAEAPRIEAVAADGTPLWGEAPPRPGFTVALAGAPFFLLP